MPRKMDDAGRIEIADDFLVMTVGLYEFFMANDANDSLRVYLHLLYASRRQQNRSVWANTSFIAKGCGMGIARVKKAKAWLVKRGVIEYRQEIEEGKHGKGKVYTVLKTTIRSGGMEISPPENQPSCVSTPEVLREQGEVLREKGNSLVFPKTSAAAEYPPAFDAWWAAYPRKKTKKAAYAKWVATLKKGATEADLQQAAENYAAECERQGTAEMYTKHPATFLGPSEPWRDYLGDGLIHDTLEEAEVMLFGRR